MINSNISSLIDVIRNNAERCPDRIAYTFLTGDNNPGTDVSYADLDRRARAVAAWFGQQGITGERVLIAYPQCFEYLYAFFGCLYAGNVAVPLYPPHLKQAGSDPRLTAVIRDAQPAVACTSRRIIDNLFGGHGEGGHGEGGHGEGGHGEGGHGEGGHDEPAGKLITNWIDIAEIDMTLAEEWRPPVSDTTALAYLQYTSGSTSLPKGVMVAHDNLLYNLRMLESVMVDPGDEPYRIVSWLPLFHDMGLVVAALLAAFTGGRCVLMSPQTFLRRPFLWLEAITRYRARLSASPNFGYDLCVEKITSAERELLELSSWQVALNGAETVRYRTLERFAETFASCGFRSEAHMPAYGLAEATVFVSGGSKAALPLLYDTRLKKLQVFSGKSGEQRESSLTYTGCGRAVLDEQIRIINPETLTPCGPGEIGEIWVAGPHICRGYWQKTTEMSRIFGAYPAGTREGPFLRTGDLGFIIEGELFISGRLKDVVIIRGRNYYPQDIEQTVQTAHPLLHAHSSAAFAIWEAEQERLVIVQGVKRAYRDEDATEIFKAIRRAVMEMHEVQVYDICLVQPVRIPKTTSGKIQRQECRRMYLAGELSPLAVLKDGNCQAAEEDSACLAQAILTVSRTNDLRAQDGRLELLSRYLRACIGRVLRNDISRHVATESLHSLAIDSLLAAELAACIEKELGVLIPMTAFLDGSTLNELAEKLAGLLAQHPEREEQSTESSRNTGKQETWPLSVGQQALWTIYKMSPESAAYNLPLAMRIRQKLDAGALERACRSLMERHVLLKSAIRLTEQGPQCFLCPLPENFLLQVSVTSGQEANRHTREARLRAWLLSESHRPFPLEAGPPWRAGLFSLTGEEHVLLIVAHHLVADFWSLVNLVRELGVLYEAERTGAVPQLPVPAADYADYVRWQTALLDGTVGDRLSRYWRNHLAGELPVLALPADYTRPVVRTFRGDSLTCRLDREMTARLEAFSNRQGVTLYPTLLAAFQILLHRYSGQQEILVGSPVAGRSRAVFAEAVGYFVNTLVHRSSFQGDLSFARFLAQTQQNVLKAMQHQDYPFMRLVEELQPEREAVSSPLCQVLFTYYNTGYEGWEYLAASALGVEGVKWQTGGLSLESMTAEMRISQFDLTLTAASIQGELVFLLKYNTDIFTQERMQGFLAHWQALLAGILADAGQPVSCLSLLSPSERHKVLVDWNQSTTVFADKRSVVELFEAQAEHRPTAPALNYAGSVLSYSELNSEANRLAHYLQARGVGTEVLTGVYLERSREMMIAILGVLKAGGGYVPLEPAWPERRVSAILQEAGVKLVVTHSRLREKLPADIQSVCLDEEREALAAQPAGKPAGSVRPENIAYVLFTSGSTGLPKGVVIERRQLDNYVQAVLARADFPAAGHFALVSTIAADLGNTMLYPALCSGGCLHVIEEALLTNPSEIAAYFNRHTIDCLKIVPSHLSALCSAFTFTSSLGQCRRLILGGEVFSRSLAERLAPFVPNGQIFNHYGPTETTVGVLMYPLEPASLPPEAGSVPLGRPLSNNRIYLLDKHLNPVPPGVAGEVYISGAQVARGYLGNPRLTAERFVPNPFEEGVRMYKTGDLARFLPDGLLEFKGRTDFQVKVNGYRVDPAEIESVLLRHPAMREAVVIACSHTGDEGQPDEPEDRRLTAYLVTGPGAVLTASDVRSYARQYLPEYMLPQAVVFMDELPLTPNGKVDRRALPVQEVRREDGEEKYVAPRTPVEEVLAGIWRNLLKVDRVGVYDNFFELGGHSLMAVQAMTQLQELFALEEPLVALFFENPTVAGVAEALTRSLGANGSADLEKTAQILMMIDGMSDEEVEQMLAETGAADESQV